MGEGNTILKEGSNNNTNTPYVIIILVKLLINPIRSAVFWLKIRYAVQCSAVQCSVFVKVRYAVQCFRQNGVKVRYAVQCFRQNGAKIRYAVQCMYVSFKKFLYLLGMGPVFRCSAFSTDKEVTNAINYFSRQAHSIISTHEGVVVQ
jgi:hypothetical protein